MKKSLLVLTSILALLLTGCNSAKPYVDVKSSDYATFKLVPKTSKTFGTLDAYIDDYSLGCKKAVRLGMIETGPKSESRTIKLPVDRPIWIRVNFESSGYSSSQLDSKIFVLTPEKDKEYVVVYILKDLSFTQTISDFDVHMVEDGTIVDIPSSRIRDFNYVKECK